jgi:hypothetical protein
MSETLTDRDFWSTVPSVEEPAERDDGPDPPATMGDRVARVTATRRVTLKALATLGGALALNMVSWLPPFRARSAHATVGHEYGDCNTLNYDDSKYVCHPWPESPNYCGSDGWFLQASQTCFASGAVVTCAGGTPKNAWRWARGGTAYRCADGVQYWCGGYEYRICVKANPGAVVP